MTASVISALAALWSIRTKLQVEGRVRDLALFNLAIDSKLRGCDVLALKIDVIAPSGYAVDRATVRQKKAGRPVKFELTEATGQTVDDYVEGVLDLQQLDTADRQEPSEALKTKTSRLKEKIAMLKEQMQRLEILNVQMLATPDQKISLTDPDARSMATSGRGSGVVGYNVQVAVDTEHHLIVTYEVTNVGTDRSQLAHMAKEAKATLEVEKLDAVADRGYFNSEEILACEEAGITVTLPKPMTSNSKAEGRFGKQDFRYVAEEDVYICPAGERLTYHYTNEENGLVLRRYWTNACQRCAIKHNCG
jgi:hypothetical protein